MKILYAVTAASAAIKRILTPFKSSLSLSSVRIALRKFCTLRVRVSERASKKERERK